MNRSIRDRLALGMLTGAGIVLWWVIDWLF